MLAKQHDTDSNLGHCKSLLCYW